YRWCRAAAVSRPAPGSSPSLHPRLPQSASIYDDPPLSPVFLPPAPPSAWLLPSLDRDPQRHRRRRGMGLRNRISDGSDIRPVCGGAASSLSWRRCLPQHSTAPTRATLPNPSASGEELRRQSSCAGLGERPRWSSRTVPRRAEWRWAPASGCGGATARGRDERSSGRTRQRLPVNAMADACMEQYHNPN
ncbi:unnamed protein product, partial [Urochloa humidicola]